jgi:hypothetical protein
MDNIQLQQILQKAYEETFLSRMELLVESDKEYKKSDFFKNTKISLFDLYNQYETYLANKNMIIDEFNAFIEKLDTEIVVQKISEFLTDIEKDKKIVEILNDIIEYFSTEKVSEYATMIQEAIDKIKV